MERQVAGSGNSGGGSSDSQTTGIYLNIIIGTITVFFSFILFEFFRRKMTSIFEARRVLHERGDPLDCNNDRVYCPPPPSYKPLGWLRPVLQLDLETVARTHGLDTALFLRFLRTMIYLFLLILIPTIPLIPIYGTGPNKDSPDPARRTAGIQQFSLSNVSLDDPWRFWVTLCADYLVVILVLCILYREFAIYAKCRIDYRASTNPCNYAIFVEDIPSTSRSLAGVYHYWNRLFPNDVKRVFLARDDRILLDEKQEFWKAVAKRERAEWDEVHTCEDGERPTHKAGTCSCLRGESSKVDSIDYWRDEQGEHANKLAHYQRDPDSAGASLNSAAVVVFENRRTASVAAQTNFQLKEHEWRVERAPEPKAVNWSAFSIPGYQVGIRNFITIVTALALTLFWVVPVTFIMSLTSLTTLSELEINGHTPFSFLQNLIDWNSTIFEIIESYLPAVILSLFLKLIPTFLRLILSIARVPSLANLDRQVRDWYFNFIIFSNFLFVIVSGSLLNELTAIIRRPERSVDFLASTAPKQGAFIMNFVLIQAFTEAPKEILQIGRVIIRWFKLTFLSRTTRERKEAEIGDPEFKFYKYYAVSQLIALLGIIYSTIAPFIIPCVLGYFVVMYIVWKYTLCFSLYNEYRDGGKMYGGALYGALTGLFLHLLTMIGIFGLNRSSAQSILVVFPAIICLVFLRTCRVSFTDIIEHGSALASLRHAEESEGVDVIPAELAEKYTQPGFIPLPDHVENLSGVPVKGKIDEFSDMEKGHYSKKRHDSKEDAGLNGKRMSNYESTLAPKQKSKTEEEWADAISGEIPITKSNSRT